MMILRTATKSDNEGLLSLTRSTPMKGVISLCIDRQPDFFSLLKYRGQHEVIVAVEDALIVGSFSVSQQKIFFGGKPEIIFYLADFKVHPDYRGTSVAVRLVRAMLDYLQAQSADLLCCTAADGNNLVTPFFQGRLGIPAWKDIGRFIVFQILPSRILPDKSVDVQQKVPAGFSLIDYYQQFYLEHYKVAPELHVGDIEKTVNLVAFVDGKLVAAITLMDTSALKQNVVIDMPFWLKAVVFISKSMGPAFGWLSLPGVGESIRMLNIRFWAYSPGAEGAFRALVQHARNIAAAEKYHFLSVGVHERDPVQAILGSFRHIPFTSKGFVTSLKNDKEKMQSMLNGVIFEDFSMV